MMLLHHIKVLQKLSIRPQTSLDLSNEEIQTARYLVRKKLACDFSDIDQEPLDKNSRRRKLTPIHLRIWGINPAGRAILDQLSLTSQITKHPDPPIPLSPLENKSSFFGPIKYRRRTPKPPTELLQFPRHHKPEEDKPEEPND